MFCLLDYWFFGGWIVLTNKLFGMKKLLCFAAIICLFAASCKQKFQETVIDEMLAQYISVVTSGEINCDDEIMIRFNNVGAENILKELDISEPIFSFHPKIKGRTYWKDPYTVAFKPNSNLQYGRKYQGTIDLSKLQLAFLPDSIKEFKFVVNVPEMAVVQCDNQLDLINSNDPNFYRYRAEIVFTAAVDTSLLAKGLSLKSNGKTIGTKIKRKDDLRTVELESESIERTNKAKKIVLSVDKQIFGMAKTFASETELAPITEMKVLSITQDLQGKNPKIRVEFSDELSSKQDLNGLISISPAQPIKLHKTGSRLLIDGNFAFGSTYTLTLNEGLQSRWETRTSSKVTEKISFPDVEPQIEFVSDGIFLPSSNDFKIQFYSCNLKKVHIELKKVFDSGLREFVTSEQLSSLKNRHQPFEGSYVNRVGVIIHNEAFEIGNQKNEWLLSEVDLTKIIKEHGKGLYLIQLNFNSSDMLTKANDDLYPYIQQKGQIYKPVIFSNIGLTCKKSGSDYWVYATNLITAKPMSNVKIQLSRYWSGDPDYKGVTDSDGKVCFHVSETYNAFSHVLAEKNGEQSVLKFSEMEWNTSGFDVSGSDQDWSKPQAFTYTDRGVYRPGDLINFSVIVRQHNVVTDFPLTVELCNPQSKVVYVKTDNDGKDGFFNFAFQTSQSDMTGQWIANFYIGNTYFSHPIKIETVVSNTLKAQINTDKATIEKGDSFVKIDLMANYLFGAPASGNMAELSAEFLSLSKTFKGYERFVFSNPSVDFYSFGQTIAQKNLDENGKLSINYDLPSFEYAPSSIIMKIRARIVEKGGRPNDFYKYLEVNSVRYYVGIQSDEWNNVRSGSEMNIPVVLLDVKGNPVVGKTLKYRIYRNEENWWWQYDTNRKLRFKSDIKTSQVAEGEVLTSELPAAIRFVPIEGGSYFVEVQDEAEDGHSSGMFFDAYRYGSGSGDNPNAGTLVISSDRKKYVPGQTMKIEFPSVENGQALVSIEQGNKILSSKWYKTRQGKTMQIEIPVTEAMVPNVYVSVSLIQPQEQTNNDRPIRMFGILPITVVNPSTAFGIGIKTAASYRPGEPFEISLQSNNHKPCRFTIAVVDEGLLDLTAFETPSPWNYFFRKIGLQVNTYDLYSQVITPNLDDVFRTFSIGGGMSYLKSQLAPNTNNKRFQTVSLFKGPVETDANGAATIRFDMPNYVGSVRIMVVAASKNSYANAEKVVPVKKELMLLPTLPRVLGPDETVKIPVTVLAMEKGIGKVTVSLEVTSPLEIVGDSKQTVNFTEVADKECFFTVKSKEEIGSSKIKVVAESQKLKADYSTELSIRPSSPRIFESESKAFKPAQTIALKVPQKGITGSNIAQLSVSVLPGMEFGHRLSWLINYPYGCLEQTVSAAMPQLRMAKFIDYPEAETKKIDGHINAAIERLRYFQTYSGEFTYWQGGEEISVWASLYATHFLVEAKSLGYYVPDDLLDAAIRELKSSANSNKGSYMERVYRVFILVLANQAVNSEMNLLYENKKHVGNNASLWQLAAAFYLNGQKDKSQSLVSNIGKNVEDYLEFSGTFGSGLRDQSIILEALVIMDEMNQATEMAKDVSSKLAAQNWYSTQSLGYAVNAMGKYVEREAGSGKSLKIKGQVLLPDGNKLAFDTSRSQMFNLSAYSGKEIQLVIDPSSSFEQAFAVFNYSGMPLINKEKPESKNLALNVEWFDENGNSTDPAKLKQGSSIWAHFNVKNLSNVNLIEEMALVFVIPSGWEIQNTRLNSEVLPSRFDGFKLGYEKHQEIRDDRVMWFFDLYKNEPLFQEIDFVVKMNAVYQGRFYMPGIIVEAMYNNGFAATSEGKTVTVE